MIPDAGRGSSTGGLIRYLFGRGRSNEHLDPHVVAASTPEWVRGGELADLLGGAAGRRRLVRDLDAAMFARDVDVAGGHVYHVSLALHARDGTPGAAVWRHVVDDAVRSMGLDRCRWAAVHHGPSLQGNDHVHLVVNLVQDDGTVASVWRDRHRWREWAQRIERERGWTPTGPSGSGQRDPGAREVRRSRQVGRPLRARGRVSTNQNRHLLEVFVHRCAALARTEAEFVALLVEHGITFAPHVSGGQVRGWRLQDPGSREWIAAGTLRRDFSLPRLRARWPGPPAPPSTWRHPPASPGRTAAGGEQLVQRLLRDAERELQQLLTGPAPGTATWCAAARQVSDLLLVAPSAGVSGEVARHLTEARAELALAAEPPHRARGARARPVVVPVLAEAVRAVAATGTLTPLVAAGIVLLALALVTLLARAAADHQVHPAARHRVRLAVEHLAYAGAAARAVDEQAPAPKPSRNRPPRRAHPAAPPLQQRQQPGLSRGR